MYIFSVEQSLRLAVLGNALYNLYTCQQSLSSLMSMIPLADKCLLLWPSPIFLRDEGANGPTIVQCEWME